MLEPGDLITHITLPPPNARATSRYLKLRDRASYEFALASAAVVVEVADKRFRFVRIAMGGVGTKPWRMTAAEQALTGAAVDEGTIQKARDARTSRRAAAEREWFQGRVGAAMPRARVAPRDGDGVRMSRRRESSHSLGAPRAPALLGGKLPRIDGPLKVSGRAGYTSDVSLPGMLYAVPVPSTIASGRVISIDASAARKLPGVRAVYYRGNIKPFFRSAPPQGFSGLIDEKRPPFEDDVVRYYGQYVAVAVAQTMEQAKAAADAIRVRYAAEAHNVELPLVAEKLETDSARGDADAAFQSAPVQVDQTYVTPTEVHNPIELHATVAAWDGDEVTLYETSQAVMNHRDVLYQMLGVPKENVRVVSHFLGSGFGGKLWPWTHSIIAAGVAREVGAPVKLVVTRQSMFQTVGHRPRTQQRFRIGATR